MGRDCLATQGMVEVETRTKNTQVPLRLHRRGWLAGLGLAALGAAAQPGCYGASQTLFTRLGEARRSAADLRLQFNKAADASNLAVMSDIKETTSGFAEAAEEAKRTVRQEQGVLEAHLLALRYEEELRLFKEFAQSFAEYEKVDQATLKLAAENTNVRARKLSFGPALEQADAFRDMLDRVVREGATDARCRVGPLVYAAVSGVREMQVLHAPHIAEAEGARMGALEKRMQSLEDTVREALKELAVVAPGSAQLAEANAAFDRFEETHRQILALSRRNTNVITMATSLGSKRAVITACDSSLAQLENGLRQRGAVATR